MYGNTFNNISYFSLNSWSTTATVIGGIANYLTTEDQLATLQEFIDAKGHMFGSSVSILENAAKTVEKNLAWSKKHLGNLFQYLDKRNAAMSIKSLTTLLVLMLIVVFKLN